MKYWQFDGNLFCGNSAQLVWVDDEWNHVLAGIPPSMEQLSVLRVIIVFTEAYKAKVQ